MFTGIRIDAAEAERLGLVDRALPDAELWSATLDIARTISGNAPLAIQAVKELQPAPGHGSYVGYRPN